METKKKNILLLVSLLIFLVVLNYSWIDGFLVKSFENIDKEDFIVKRIIDGDTIVVGDDLHVRLMGINAPERGEKYYDEAREFLENLILDKTVFIEFFGKDKYYRELGYVFIGNKNVNIELVKNGLANVYILEEKDYEKELRNAWENCFTNLCKPSTDVCAKCIELKELSFEYQKVVLKNVCDFDCSLKGWTIKDEGRKKFVFENEVLSSGEEIIVTAKDFGEDYVWTKTGDTLFLWDDEKGLVLWELKYIQ